MKTLEEYVFLKKTTVSKKSTGGIEVSGSENEPVGELVAGPESVPKGTYAYDPRQAFDITIKGETYKVTERKYLLATEL